jgi:hypothetical protein
LERGKRFERGRGYEKPPRFPSFTKGGQNPPLIPLYERGMQVKERMGKTPG